MDEKVLLNTLEAAKILKIRTGTLNNWRYNDKGPPYHKLGGKIFYDQKDVTAFIERHKIDPEAQG